ncbi:hypothetical protein [Enhygromyxa salina]|uniref:Uncharacterized protein n=1 Tax=Enhygromyxa salina TaxID=215803 RepID=A0A2S9XUI4_9BACT|nr:hypothetical protein [Enhygromyxa salina]PRP96371.1 hypothetical protein ENSA7_71860 [Enhygromyxa salina]
MAGLSDTSPEVRARMLEIYARMTPREKFRRVLALTEMSWLMAIAGLRTQHPDASERELRRLLAQRMYGKELVPDLPKTTPPEPATTPA